MSGPNEKSVTHDSFGKEPAAAENLTFELKWKNSGEDGNDIIPVRLSNSFDTTEKRNWNSFKKILHDVAFGHGYSIAERVTYVDSDGDEIPIESQCEFEEALKFAKTRATKKRSVFLIVENNSTGEKKRDIENLEKVDLICLDGNTLQEQQSQFAMPPMQLDEVREVGRGQWQSQCCNAIRATQAEGLGDTAPKWFTNYMQTMKEDIVTEVSKRVTKTVMDALSKKRESQYDSATSHPQALDSDCLLDSDFDEDRSEHYSIKSTWPSRVSREDRINSTEQVASNSPETRDKKTSDVSSRSGALRFENSRRHYRHADKQRKKHNKNHVSQTPCPDETWHSSSSNRRQGEKAAKKRETNEARGSLPQSSENLARPKLISVPISVRDVEKDVEETNTPYRRIMESGIKQTSFTPVDSTDLLEAPILKLRLADPYNGNEQNVEPKLTEDKLRMGCSVTGQDMLERPNDRVPEYDALSDSDNISIISDISHASDMQRINNSFEMILQRSMNFADEDETYGNDRLPVITTEFPQTDRETDDVDNTRDSSSFELLSEPPSPALSIHMDEDHFSPGENETSNYNMNDDTTLDKRGNQSKIEICPYAIDAQGKIYQQNITEGDEVREEIVLEKRSGGAYSFVGETLPASTKESMIIAENRSEESTEEVLNAAVGAPENVACDVGVEVTIETNLDARSRGNAVDAFHESTQSFHSHTASQAENDRQDFAAFATNSGPEETPGTPRSHVFVDRNASKGLGDTRRSSPRKQPSASNKNPEEARSERPRSNRKTSHDSHASGNRSSNPRQGERSSRRFANWSTTRSTQLMDDLVFNAVDPMHILPETLVTGAVHVASSAYTTARRVYDKILTAQTRKPADKSKFGRR